MSEAEGDAPDQGPQLPRSGAPSGLALVYAALGGVVLVVYVLAGARGWHFFEPERAELPSSVRHSPGGYRSYSFWHTGYQGGK
jgi:hypothetical protein